MVYIISPFLIAESYPIVGYILIYYNLIMPSSFTDIWVISKLWLLRITLKINVLNMSLFMLLEREKFFSTLQDSSGWPKN